MKFNRLIKAISTAIIGAGMLCYGVGCYAGNFPSMFRLTKLDVKNFNDVNYYYIGYLVGFLFFSSIGTCIQLKYIDQKEKKFDFDAYQRDEEKVREEKN